MVIMCNGLIVVGCFNVDNTISYTYIIIQKYERLVFNKKNPLGLRVLQKKCITPNKLYESTYLKKNQFSIKVCKFSLFQYFIVVTMVTTAATTSLLPWLQLRPHLRCLIKYKRLRDQNYCYPPIFRYKYMHYLY